jgi:pimeloyl-ACP methyl ester carboxylesterase
VIVFDNRGTGLSDRVPLVEMPTIEQRMYDLRAVMHAVGSRRAVLCGVSEGGPMSAVFAATYPERTLALIMIGTYAKRIRSADYPWGPTAAEREEFIREIQDHWGGPVGLEERAPSLANDRRFRDWWAAYLRMGASPGAAVALTRMNGEIDVRNVLSAVRVPALVLHRTGDRCLLLEEGRYVASRIPGATFVELPGIDHLPFVGDQDSILREIEQFVARARHTMGHDRLLATVLAMEFPGADSSILSNLADQALSEVKWYRGSNTAWAGQRLLATFDGPARAVRCACELRGYASKKGVGSRAGLHTGECESSFGDAVAGPAVDTATAIQARAAKEEILVSTTVRDLVAGSGLQFESAGKLRHSDQEWQLFRVPGEAGST